MKKLFLLACLVSICAATSFAQSPANAEGARLVAQRDAAYAKAHPAPPITRITPTVHHGHKLHAHRKIVNKVTK